MASGSNSGFASQRGKQQIAAIHVALSEWIFYKKKDLVVLLSTVIIQCTECPVHL